MQTSRSELLNKQQRGVGTSEPNTHACVMNTAFGGSAISSSLTFLDFSSYTTVNLSQEWTCCRQGLSHHPHSGKSNDVDEYTATNQVIMHMASHELQTISFPFYSFRKCREAGSRLGYLSLRSMNRCDYTSEYGRTSGSCYLFCYRSSKALTDSLRSLWCEDESLHTWRNVWFLLLLAMSFILNQQQLRSPV